MCVESDYSRRYSLSSVSLKFLYYELYFLIVVFPGGGYGNGGSLRFEFRVRVADVEWNRQQSLVGIGKWSNDKTLCESFEESLRTS